MLLDTTALAVNSTDGVRTVSSFLIVKPPLKVLQ